MPVVFHNLKGYDSHLIMQHLGKLEAEVTCIPNNMEKYISFTVADRYIAKAKPRQNGNGDGGVNEDENDIFMDVDEDEETDNIELNEPSSDKGSKKKVSRLLNLRFIDSLAFMNCSLENLVEIRETCLKCYSLDPCHYFTAPGLSWDACLRKCGITLELLSDPDMHLMIEKGIRGGISTITHRHAKANNKYLKDFDPNKGKHSKHLCRLPRC